MRGSEDLPEVFYDVIIVDSMMHPIGDVRLGPIMGTVCEALIAELKTDNCLGGADADCAAMGAGRP